MGGIVQKLIDGVLEVLCLILLMVAVGVLFPIATVLKWLDNRDPGVMPGFFAYKLLFMSLYNGVVNYVLLRKNLPDRRKRRQR